MTDIRKINERIRKIDQELQQLFEKRMNAVAEAAELKKNSSAFAEGEVSADILNQADEKYQSYSAQFHNALADLSRQYQSVYFNQANPFLNIYNDISAYADFAFEAAQKAREDSHPEKINATIGTLYDEDGKIVSLKSIYDSYRKVDDRRKASYAERIDGNESFNEAVFSWINRKDNIRLCHSVIASPGGSGALNIAIKNCLKEHETLLIPSIAWGSYAVMAKQYRIATQSYKLTSNQEVDLGDLKKSAQEVMNRQHKVVIVINDPCHNPSGISYGRDKWHELIEFFNGLSRQGQVIIINDIAYFDYARDYENVTDYMAEFNHISENILLFVAFSCSKSFTAYGMRLGALITLARRPKDVEEVTNSLLRSARASWSNVNNGFMDCVVDVLKNHQQQYIEEKKHYIDLLQQRAQLFKSQADEAGLEIYPYTEGFFITVAVDSDISMKYHQALMNSHIYCVRFSEGIRVAICGLSLKQIDGLAFRLKEILEKIE